LALRDAKLAQEALSGAIGTLNKFYAALGGVVGVWDFPLGFSLGISLG
jgi:hypothetical protein